MADRHPQPPPGFDRGSRSQPGFHRRGQERSESHERGSSYRGRSDRGYDDRRGGGRNDGGGRHRGGGRHPYSDRGRGGRGGRGGGGGMSMELPPEAIEKRVVGLKEELDQISASIYGVPPQLRTLEVKVRNTTGENSIKTMPARPNMLSDLHAKGITFIKRTTVMTNTFRLAYRADRGSVVHQYQLTATKAVRNPDELSAEMAAKLEKTIPSVEEARGLIRTLAEQEQWPKTGWAFDSRSTLIALPKTAERILEIPREGLEAMQIATGGKGLRRTMWNVTLQKTCEVDMRCVTEPATYFERVRVSARVEDWMVREAHKVLSVLFKHAALMDVDMMSIGAAAFNCQRAKTVPLFGDDRGGGGHGHGGHGNFRAIMKRPLDIIIGLNSSTAATTDGLVLLANSVPALTIQAMDIASMMRNWGCPMDRAMSPEEPLFAQANRLLKGMEIVVKSPKGYRNYTVLQLSPHTADSYDFDIGPDDSRENVNVTEYIRRTYNYRLHYPHANLLDVSRSKRPKNGPVLIAPELATVRRGQLEATGTKYAEKLKKVMAVSPQDKEAQTRQAIENFLTDTVRSHLEPWLEVPDRVEFTQTPAFLLEPPVLQYVAGSEESEDHPTRQPKYFQASHGSWNAGSTPFLRPGELRGFGVVIIGDNYDELFIKGLVMGFVNKAYEVGMVPDIQLMRQQAGNVVFRCQHGDVKSAVAQAFRAALQSFKPRPEDIENIVIFVAMPGKSDYYRDVKRVCETAAAADIGRELNLPALPHIKSLCFVPDKAEQGQHMYALNIAFKLNYRLGGVNFSLGEMRENLPDLSAWDLPYMFLGADVTHPSQQGFHNTQPMKSIAALVGSMDPQGSQYRAVPVVQAGRQEAIDSVKDATKQLILQFIDESKDIPKLFVFYRDGVDEGQYASVLETEVAPMKQAIDELCGDEATMAALRSKYELDEEEHHREAPKLTVVVVRKRNQLRFFPVLGGEQATPIISFKNGNVQPGLCIDTTVCSPYRFNWYMVSAAAIKGTARPVEYCVILDEIGFTIHGLALLTYWLCYTYSRCARSVSVPPPVYYAHHCCSRVRHIHDSLQPDPQELQRYEEQLARQDSTYCKRASMLFV